MKFCWSFYCPLLVKQIAWTACILYCIIPCSAPAQSGPIFTRYTQEEGLATASVSQMVKEKHGFLWLACENGIIRFDGYNFKNFKNNEKDSSNIPFTNFYELMTDPSGVIYFRNRNSISRYFPESGAFKKVMFIHDSLLYNDWAFNSTSLIWATSKNKLLCINVKDSSIRKFPYPADFYGSDAFLLSCTQKAIWMGNEHGQFIRFDPGTRDFFKERVGGTENFVNQVNGKRKNFFEAPDGSVYFLTNKCLYQYDEIKHSFFQRKNCSLEPGSEERYQGGACMLNGLLYSGTSKGNLRIMDCKNDTMQVVHLSAKDEPGSEFAFRSIYPGYDSTIWISTTNAGVFHYLNRTGTWYQITHDPNNQNSLLSNTTDFICANEKSLVWINSPGRGFVKVEWTRPSLDSFLPALKENSTLSANKENVRSIHSLESGNLLIGTLGGLLEFDRLNKSFREFSFPGSDTSILPRSAISCIVKDKNGNIWISEWSTGAIYYLNEANRRFGKCIPDSSLPRYSTIRTLFCDSHGMLWAGSDRNTLYRADISSLDYSKPLQLVFKTFRGDNSTPGLHGFKSSYVISENKKGRVLFGMANGFYGYDYSNGKFSHFFNVPGDTTSLSDDDIRSICVDSQGRIWLGTNNGGLNVFNETKRTFRTFTTTNGLPDNTIYSILEDGQGFLWLGTNKGLCRFNPVNNNCRNFTLRDGIQNYEYNTSASFKTRSGELVIGGRSGFNYFHPDSIETASEAPEVMITEFRIFGNEYPLSGGTIRLSHRENSISFDFAALSFIRNTENEYAYKLEGLDKDWIYCGDRRFTNYSNLAPGTYTFRVKASNCFGLWNETGASVTLVIATPWWATIFFRISILFYAAILIYALFLFRLRQKMKLQGVRNRIARDLHDEIGSNLSSISLFNEVAKGNAGESSALTPMLKKIGEYTQISQEAMNDIVWMINVRNDKFENIIIHMRTLAAELFEAKGIMLNLFFDDRLNSLKMEMARRKDFFLVYKEALNNIIKYAECRNVWIDLKQDGAWVNLTIRDDGKGFDMQQEVRGNGLINMQKRAEALKGKFTIQSEPGKGTRVELTFKRR